jgi:hypothetical protein
MRVEVVLRHPDRGDEVTVHNRPLTIGEVIQTDQEWWRVTSKEPPTIVGASLRFVCAPAARPGIPSPTTATDRIELRP